MIYLFRQSGAIGAASHWARKFGPFRGFEFLGCGTQQPAHRSALTKREFPARIQANGVALCRDMTELRS